MYDLPKNNQQLSFQRKKKAKVVKTSLIENDLSKQRTISRKQDPKSENISQNEDQKIATSMNTPTHQRKTSEFSQKTKKVVPGTSSAYKSLKNDFEHKIALNLTKREQRSGIDLFKNQGQKGL